MNVVELYKHSSCNHSYELFECPYCRKYFTSKNWNKTTLKVIKDKMGGVCSGKLSPIENRDEETFFYCPNCMEESTMTEDGELGVDYIY